MDASQQSTAEEATEEPIDIMIQILALLEEDE